MSGEHSAENWTVNFLFREALHRSRLRFSVHHVAESLEQGRIGKVNVPCPKELRLEAGLSAGRRLQAIFAKREFFSRDLGLQKDLGLGYLDVDLVWRYRLQ